MKSIIIAGCSRSGIILIAGSLAATDRYGFEKNLWTNEFNEYGYFYGCFNLPRLLFVVLVIDLFRIN